MQKSNLILAKAIQMVLNEVLIADVVKPEIDKVDESDRQEANRKRQEAIVQSRKDDEEFDSN